MTTTEEESYHSTLEGWDDHYVCTVLKGTGSRSTAREWLQPVNKKWPVHQTSQFDRTTCDPRPPTAMSEEWLPTTTLDCQSCTSSCSCPVRRCLLPSKYPCLIRADWSGLMVSSTLFMSYWWQQRVWSKNSWDGQSQCLVYSRFCLSFTRGVTDVFICKWWGLRSFPFTTRLLRRGFKDKSRFCLEKVNL